MEEDQNLSLGEDNLLTDKEFLIENLKDLP